MRNRPPLSSREGKQAGWMPLATVLAHLVANVGLDADDIAKVLGRDDG
jgi:hypothetical protein